MSYPVNHATIDLIKRNEGCVLHAYPDPATGGDPWTIGFGHTGSDVSEGLEWSQEQADAALKEDLHKFEDGVDALLEGDVTDNQFGAMVSLAYNIGLGHFAESSVLREHNAGNYQTAAKEFMLWDKAAGEYMEGLHRRRAEESALYLTP